MEFAGRALYQPGWAFGFSMIAVVFLVGLTGVWKNPFVLVGHGEIVFLGVMALLWLWWRQAGFLAWKKLPAKGRSKDDEAFLGEIWHQRRVLGRVFFLSILGVAAYWWLYPERFEDLVGKELTTRVALREAEGGFLTPALDRPEITRETVAEWKGVITTDHPAMAGRGEETTNRRLNLDPESILSDEVFLRILRNTGDPGDDIELLDGRCDIPTVTAIGMEKTCSGAWRIVALGDGAYTLSFRDPRHAIVRLTGRDGSDAGEFWIVRPKPGQ